MGIRHLPWDTLDDDTLLSWGNAYYTIRDGKGLPVHEGMYCGWAESPSGTLQLRKRVQLDDDHTVAFDAFVLNTGAWATIDIKGAVFDLEAMIEEDERQTAELARQQEEQDAALAAMQLGVQPSTGRITPRGTRPR